MSDQANEPRVGVVLVNWNAGELTAACIESLLAGSRVPWRILVVDNASGDGSLDRLRERFPQVRFIANETNEGFTGANNRGIRALLAGGAEWVWVLNNNTEVAPDCLAALLDGMARHPEFDAASAKVHFANPPGRIWYGGADEHPWSLLCPHRGYGREDGGGYDAEAEVPFISGCCIFARQDAWLRAGLFDDAFFAYCEDLEWCHRARRRGLRLGYLPGAVIAHHVSASLRKSDQEGGATPPLWFYLSTRNRLFVVRRHARWPFQWPAAMASAFGTALLYAGVLAARRRWKKLSSLARGLRDGLRTPLAGRGRGGQR